MATQLFVVQTKKSAAEAEFDQTFALFGILLGVIILAFVGMVLAIIGAVGGTAYLIYAHYAAKRRTAEAHVRMQMLYDDAVRSSSRSMDRKAFAAHVITPLATTLPESVLRRCFLIAASIYDDEKLNVVVPPLPADPQSEAAARYRDELAKISGLNDTKIIEIAGTLTDAFREALSGVPHQSTGGSVIAVPIQQLLPNIPDAVYSLLAPVYRDTMTDVLKRTRKSLDANLAALKGDLPDKYRGSDAIHDYLKDTYFEGLFHETVNLHVPPRVKYEHAVVTAGTGHGKTTLLENLFLESLETGASIVVIDSQQQLIQKLSRLQRLHERNLIIVDPKDSPALNVFAVPQRAYGLVEREQMRNHTLETFRYLFDSMLGADLTVRQTVLFNYLITLLLAMPETMGRNATLLDLVELTQDTKPFLKAINSLEPIVQNFFLKDFNERAYTQTKEQIRYRLHAILGNPTLSRLFLAPHNTMDFYQELESAIILIDTDKAFLGAQNSSYLGRVAITFILQAILERAANPGPHTPVHIYIDEAAEYFDRSIETFLTEARKHDCGITILHQHLGQMTPEFRSSVISNTGTKYAGGLSAQDARTLATDMRTSADFLLSQTRLNFGCYIRNVTPTAVVVPVTLGSLDDEPRVSDEEYQSFRAQNRARLSIMPTPVVTPEPAPETSVPPPEVTEEDDYNPVR